MKLIKSILSVLLAAVMVIGSFSLVVFAELPEITDFRWNDDYSAEFHFDGAKSYSYSIYINNNMIWGFGTTPNNTISRESILPYMASVAGDAIERHHYTGNVSFDLVLFANDENNNTISGKSIVSKVLNIEDVAAGKLSPDAEKWQYKSVKTNDSEMLSKALHAAYDPEKAKIEASLSGTTITYDQYIDAVVKDAKANGEKYIFTGTLAQTLRFCKIFNSYGFTDIRLAKKEISKIEINVAVPTHGQSFADYEKNQNIKCQTNGVKVVSGYSKQGIFENNTNTYQTKIYGGNSYDIDLYLMFEEGYSPAKNFTVTINGQKVDMIDSEAKDYTVGHAYFCSKSVKAQGNFIQTIVTFFHNIITKIKYPNGMYI